jgi:hypothetical protein
MKIVSRYLEHTLTRDNVRRDKHFSHALSLAKKLVAEKLVPQLPAELARAAEKKGSAADYLALFQYARTQLKPKQLVYRLCGGGAVSHEKVLAPGGMLVVSGARTPLVERLIDGGTAVLERELEPFVSADRVVIADEVFTYAAPPEKPTPAEFAGALKELLSELSFSRVEVSEVRGAAAELPFVWLEALSRCVTREEAEASLFSKKKGGVLCFNLAHPAVEKAVPLLTRAPRLAAMLFARMVLVHEGKLSAARDEALTKWGLA